MQHRAQDSILKPSAIGPIPTQGYRSKDHHSFNALKWLEWVSRENRVKIQHTWNGGEPRIELEDINKFQSYLGRKGYQILVFSYNTDHKEPIYKGPPRTHALVLVYHDGHYDVISS